MKIMKHILLVISAVLATVLASVAQVAPPEGFNYSGVARTDGGLPLASTTIGVQFSILKGSVSGILVYQENHVVDTDDNGVFNLVIGFGAAVSGSMSSIDWPTDNYFIQVGLDANGGTAFQTMGTSQLLSVPYAMFAKNSGNVNGVTNQNLSVSLTGDTLYISNGNWVIIPGISNVNNGTSISYSSPGAGVTDISGNTYQTVIIGNQEWMAENLRTTAFANGDPVPFIADSALWASLGTNPGYCWYDNQSSYEVPYGKMYNWYAVDDGRNLCPVGWHVPSVNDCAQLISFLDPQTPFSPGSEFAGGLMKSTGTVQQQNGVWQHPNSEATNSSGFSVVPAGYRRQNSSFSNLGTTTYIWTATDNADPNRSQCYRLQHDSGWINFPNVDKTYGIAVRCVKD